MPEKGKLFIISGPSGAGKSTVIESVLKRRPRLRYSISCTTRAPRGNEKNGVDYHFISENIFQEKMDAGEFAEWAEVHGHMYGTSATYIEGTLAAGEDVLLDIDVAGEKQLRSRFPEAVSVFIAPPTMEELEKRLTGRDTDSSGAVDQRLKNAKAEMAQAVSYDHVLVNKDLAQTVSRLEAIINNTSSNG